MKKTLTVIAAVVVVGAGGITGGAWYTGQRLEDENKAQLLTANEKLKKLAPALGLSVEQVSYQRGLFSSHAQYAVRSALAEQMLKSDKEAKADESAVDEASAVDEEIKPVDPADAPVPIAPPKGLPEAAATPPAASSPPAPATAPAAPAAKPPAPNAAPSATPNAAAEEVPRVLIDVTMEHGPFPWLRVKSGNFEPVFSTVHAEVARNPITERVFKLTLGASPLVSDLAIHYSGDSDFTGSMPPVSYKRAKIDLAFSGMKATGTFTRATSGGTLHAAIDSVRGRSPDKNDGVTLTGLTLDAATHMGKFGISLGDTDAKVKQIEVVNEVPLHKVLISDAAYLVKLGEDDKNLDIQATYQAGKVVVDNKDFGSGQLVFKASKLDGNAVQALVDKYNSLSQQLVLGGHDAQTAGMQAIMAIGASTQQILAGQPHFALDPVIWKTAKGEHRVTVGVDLGPVPVGEKDPQRIAMQMIKHMDATVTLSKPAAQDTAVMFLQEEGMAPAEAQSHAAEQMDSAIQMAQIMNIGKVDGDNLVGHYSYDNGIVDINGTKTPVQELLDRFGMGKSKPEPDSDADTNEEGDAVPEVDEPQAMAPPDGVVNQLDAQLVGRLIEEAGFTFEAGMDKDGDPTIHVDPSDTGAQFIFVAFYDCEDGEHCHDIQLTSGFATKKPASLKAVNDWNVQNRWARAYVDAKGRAVLEMDIKGLGGIGEESLKSSISSYLASTYDFAQAMGVSKAR
jgi:uncharacterized protein YdgA (DUF945 family)